MAKVRLYCGSNRSARSSLLDTRIREKHGHALLLTPTRAYASRRREQILLEGGLPGVWGRLAWSFTDFAQELLRAEGVVIRTLGSVERRLILERCLKTLARETRLEPLALAPDNAGLITHLLRVMDALKQAAIEPEEFRARIMGKNAQSPMDALVAAAYAAYQRVLLTEGRYDVPGIYWEAALRCRERRPAALHGIQAIFLDGFDDFTPSELRLLTALSGHVEEMVFGLNLDTAPDRQDVYTVPRATAVRIQQQFNAAPISLEAPSPARYSEYAASTIFWRDRPDFPRGMTADLTVVPCADLNHEVETIGRRIKRLILEEGAAPDRIAVVFRNLAPVADTVRAVFREFGIPVCMAQYRPSLHESSLGAFLTRLFEAAALWERETVLDVLTSRWMTPSAHGLAYGRLARSARIIAGHEEWVSRLEALRVRVERGEGEDILALLEQMPEAAAIIHECLEAVNRLYAGWTSLPKRAALAAHVEAFERMLQGLGAGQCLANGGPAEVIETETRAYEALLGLLSVLAAMDSGEEYSLEEFTACLQRSLQETTFLWPDGGPGVWCGEVSAIRNLTFAHVFFGGLIEGETPQPPPLNAIYPEGDIARLKQAGIVLEGHGDHHNRERLLFHHGLDAARSSLTLTWRLVKEGGRETMPSPFLAEVIELFDGHAKVVEAAPQSDAFIPFPKEAASQRDLLATSFHRDSALRKAFQEEFLPLEQGAAMEHERHSERPFGIYDGILHEPELVNAATARYGAEHHFSADQIEQYLECPFLFLVQRIMRLEAEEAPDAEFDPRVRGTILHAALQRFHETYWGRAVAEIPAEEAEQAMRGAVVEAFETHDWKSLTAPPAVRAVEQKRVETQLLRYLHIARTVDDSKWKPAHFEVSFGHGRFKSKDPLSTEAPFVMDTEAGPVRFCGRMDRIDLNEEAARLIDYKSGQLPKPAEIKNGHNVQLFVYAEALEKQLMTERRCAEAVYLRVDRNERREALLRDKKAEVQQEVRNNAAGSIARAVRGIRAGSFPPVGKTACSWCAFRNACRHEKERMERKGAGQSEEEQE